MEAQEVLKLLHANYTWKRKEKIDRSTSVLAWKRKNCRPKC